MTPLLKGPLHPPGPVPQGAPLVHPPPPLGKGPLPLGVKASVLQFLLHLVGPALQRIWGGRLGIRPLLPPLLSLLQAVVQQIWGERSGVRLLLPPSILLHQVGLGLLCHVLMPRTQLLDVLKLD